VRKGWFRLEGCEKRVEDPKGITAQIAVAQKFGSKPFQAAVEI